MHPLPITRMDLNQQRLLPALYCYGGSSPDSQNIRCIKHHAENITRYMKKCVEHQSKFHNARATVAKIRAPLATIPKFLATSNMTRLPGPAYRLSNFFIYGLFVPKKNQLRYELYGSSSAAQERGQWRWAIFAGREKRPVQVGSFYGSLEDAKLHTEAAISRLRERARKNALTKK